MDELLKLATTLGIPVLVVLLILDKLKPFVNGRARSNGDVVVKEDLKDVLNRAFEHQERSDEKYTAAIEENTRVIKRISETQGKMCSCLEKIEEKLSGL